MDSLLIALDALVSPTLLAAAFGGVLWGIIGGALPGISASITMALLLPFTYGMDPTTGIVLLAATYVGAEYGGSIPAILINTPGTNAAAATVLDGYAMNQKGLAGEALGISLACGVIGGLFGLALLVGLTGAAREGGAVVHAAGLFRARHPRHQRHRHLERRFAGEGADGRGDRPDDRHRRHRSILRRQPLHLRAAGTARRHPLYPDHDRRLRAERALHAGRRAGLGKAEACSCA